VPQIQNVLPLHIVLLLTRFVPTVFMVPSVQKREGGVESAKPMRTARRPHKTAMEKIAVGATARQVDVALRPLPQPLDQLLLLCLSLSVIQPLDQLLLLCLSLSVIQPLIQFLHHRHRLLLQPRLRLAALRDPM